MGRPNSPKEMGFWTQLFPKSADNLYMGKDAIAQLAKRVRTAPDAVIRDIPAMTPKDRLGLVRHLRKECTPLPYRPYAPDPRVAARQLVVAELIDGQRCEYQTIVKVKPLTDFYEGPTREANRFYQLYRSEWRKLRHAGAEKYLASPDRLADYVLGIGRGGDAPTFDQMAQWMTPKLYRGPHRETLQVAPDRSIRLFICEAFDLTAMVRELIAEELRWVLTQGYQITDVALRSAPGGAHRDGAKRPPCDEKSFALSGMYVFIGVFPGRTPCTIRHEILHSVYHQLQEKKPASIERLRNIYADAMKADTGLIFNDEFYMDVFLHAGHPMHNDNEFFAGAAHAFSHHGDRLAQHIQDPRTTPETRAYATAMWRFLRDDVFHGKVFTQDGQDPFR